MARLDVRGEICPRPALLVRQELADLDVGDELVVQGDYPPAERNLRRMCDKHGFDVAGDEDDADAFELHVQVTDDATIPEA
jgi:tRNA 2-thiouridine synthesizing protein A